MRFLSKTTEAIFEAKEFDELTVTSLNGKKYNRKDVIMFPEYIYINEDEKPYPVDSISQDDKSVKCIVDEKPYTFHNYDETNLRKYNFCKLYKGKKYKVIYIDECDEYNFKLGDIVECVDVPNDEHIYQFDECILFNNNEECEWYLNAYQVAEVDENEIDENYSNGNHADYYGGEDNIYEAIKVIKAWAEKNNWNGEQGFCLGNVLKYISRAGQKKGNSFEQDIQKCINYLQMLLK